jgi:hypothetical protein
MGSNFLASIVAIERWSLTGRVSVNQSKTAVLLISASLGCQLCERFHLITPTLASRTLTIGQRASMFPRLSCVRVAAIVEQLSPREASVRCGAF